MDCSGLFINLDCLGVWMPSTSARGKRRCPSSHCGRCRAGNTDSGDDAGCRKTPAPEDLLHRRFTLARVDCKEFTIEDRNLHPDIEFNEGFQIAGRVCNRYRSPAELKDGKLYAENLASTRMLCVNPELNELEQQFFAMLRAGADISLTGDGMTLSQGGRVLSYSRADWVR